PDHLGPEMEGGVRVAPPGVRQGGPGFVHGSWAVSPAPRPDKTPRHIDKRAFGRLRQRSRMLANLGVLQEKIARLVPDHEAVVWGDRVWSHADVAARSRRIAN